MSTKLYPADLVVFWPGGMAPASPDRSWEARGQVLATTSAVVRHEITQLSAMLGDLDLEDPPAYGLWVWSGHFVYTVGPDTESGPGEVNVEWRGRYRRATDVELAAIALGRTPWVLVNPRDPKGPALFKGGLCPGCRRVICACRRRRPPPPRRR